MRRQRLPSNAKFSQSACEVRNYRQKPFVLNASRAGSKLIGRPFQKVTPQGPLTSLWRLREHTYNLYEDFKLQAASTSKAAPVSS